MAVKIRPNRPFPPSIDAHGDVDRGGKDLLVYTASCDDRMMPSVVQLIRSSALADAPYAHAATAPAGSRLVFLAGACPLNDDGTTAAPGDYAAQASRCVETLLEALRAAGAALTDVISTRVLVASSAREDLVAAWDVIHGAFGEHDVPSTLLGVTVLGYDGQLVEVEAIAAVA